MLWKQILEMDTTDILAFSPPHPVVCMHFLGPFTPRVHIMPAPVDSTERWRQCWHKMESEKDQSMQIQKKNMMTLPPQGSWFWLLRREINFKSNLQIWMAKARCTAPLRTGRHPFRGIGLLSWLLTAYTVWYNFCRAPNKK